MNSYPKEKENEGSVYIKKIKGWLFSSRPIDACSTSASISFSRLLDANRTDPRSHWINRALMKLLWHSYFMLIKWRQQGIVLCSNETNELVVGNTSRCIYISRFVSLARVTSRIYFVREQMSRIERAKWRDVIQPPDYESLDDMVARLL